MLVKAHSNGAKSFEKGNAKTVFNEGSKTTKVGYIKLFEMSGL